MLEFPLSRPPRNRNAAPPIRTAHLESGDSTKDEETERASNTGGAGCCHRGRGGDGARGLDRLSGDDRRRDGSSGVDAGSGRGGLHGLIRAAGGLGGRSGRGSGGAGGRLRGSSGSIVAAAATASQNGLAKGLGGGKDLVCFTDISPLVSIYNTDGEEYEVDSKCQPAENGTRDILRATSLPHSARTQVVAAGTMASWLVQMHLKSLALQSLALAAASSMQGMAQLGMEEMSWAEATAKKAATATAEYFILTEWWWDWWLFNVCLFVVVVGGNERPILPLSECV